MFWGVTPHLVEPVDTVEDMLSVVDAALIEASPIEPNDQVILICGYPVGAMRPPNLALLHTIGE